MQAVDQSFDVGNFRSEQAHDVHVAERADLLQIQEDDVAVLPGIADDLVHIGQLLGIQRLVVQEGAELGLDRAVSDADLHPQEWQQRLIAGPGRVVRSRTQLGGEDLLQIVLFRLGQLIQVPELGKGGVTLGDVLPGKLRVCLLRRNLSPTVS